VPLPNRRSCLAAVFPFTESCIQYPGSRAGLLREYSVGIVETILFVRDLGLIQPGRPHGIELFVRKGLEIQIFIAKKFVT
jgi:hypothetical protein